MEVRSVLAQEHALQQRSDCFMISQSKFLQGFSAHPLSTDSTQTLHSIVVASPTTSSDAATCLDGPSLEQYTFEVHGDVDDESKCHIVWKKGNRVHCRIDCAGPFVQLAIMTFSRPFLAVLAEFSLFLYDLHTGEDYVFPLPCKGLGLAVLPSVLIVQTSQYWYVLSSPFSGLLSLFIKPKLAPLPNETPAITTSSLHINTPSAANVTFKTPSPAQAQTGVSPIFSPQTIGSGGIRMSPTAFGSSSSGPSPRMFGRRSSSSMASPEIVMRTPSPRLVSPMHEALAVSPLRMNMGNDIFGLSADLLPCLVQLQGHRKPVGDGFSSMEYSLLPGNASVRNPRHCLIVSSDAHTVVHMFRVKRLRSEAQESFFSASHEWTVRLVRPARVAFLLRHSSQHLWVLDDQKCVSIYAIRDSKVLKSLPNVLSVLPWIEQTALCLSAVSDVSYAVQVLDRHANVVTKYMLDKHVKHIAKGAFVRLSDAIGPFVSVTVSQASGSEHVSRIELPRPLPSPVDHRGKPSIAAISRMGSLERLVEAMRSLNLQEAHSVYEALKTDLRFCGWVPHLAMHMCLAAAQQGCPEWAQYYARDVPSVTNSVPLGALLVPSPSLHSLDHCLLDVHHMASTYVTSPEYEAWRTHLHVQAKSHEDLLLKLALMGSYADTLPLSRRLIVLAARTAVSALLLHRARSLPHGYDPVLASLAKALGCNSIASSLAIPPSAVPPLSITKDMFGQDTRWLEVRRMLQSFDGQSKSLPVFTLPSQFMTPEDHEAALEWTVARMQGACVGRGLQMLLSVPVEAGSLQSAQIPVPELPWTAQHPSSGAIVTCANPPPSASWSLFHHGVGCAMSIMFPSKFFQNSSSPSAALAGTVSSEIASSVKESLDMQSVVPHSVFGDDERHVDRAWIWFHTEPTADATARAMRGGILLALGLRGGLLRSLSKHDLYRVLSARDACMTAGLLVGAALSREGESDADVPTTRMLSMHIPALLPPEADVPVSSSVLAAALLAMGILYKGSGNRLVVDLLMSEIARGGAVALTAGAAMGLVCLGSGSADADHRTSMIGLKALFTGGFLKASLPHLYPHHRAGLRDDLLGERGGVSALGNRTYGSGEQDELRQDSALVPTHETAFGAILALGMMYAGTGDAGVDSLLAPPSTRTELACALAPTMTLRVVCRSLVAWNNVTAAEAWVWDQVKSIPLIRGNLPAALSALLSASHHHDFTPVACALALSSANSAAYDQSCTAHAALAARFALDGCALSLGLRYVCSQNEDCRRVLNTMADSDTALLALALVFAGSGDAVIMKRVRRRILACPNNTSTTVRERRMRTLHVALGLLFLGGGRFVLRCESVHDAAWLLLSFYIPLGEECPPASHLYLRALSASRAHKMRQYESAEHAGYFHGDIAHVQHQIESIVKNCTDSVSMRWVRQCLEADAQLPEVSRVLPASFKIRISEMMQGKVSSTHLVEYWTRGTFVSDAVACVTVLWQLPFPSEVHTFANSVGEYLVDAQLPIGMRKHAALAAVLGTYGKRYDYWICEALVDAVLKIIE